jgi:hypothetical protein
MQNTKVGPQSPVKTQNTNPTQNKSNFPQNSGKYVDSRHELGPEDGKN